MVPVLLFGVFFVLGKISRGQAGGGVLGDEFAQQRRRLLRWRLGGLGRARAKGVFLAASAVGLLAGRFAAADRLGRALPPPPPETALGSLIGHITGGHLDGGAGSFQPMNINYGLIPPLEAPKRDGEGRRLPAKERGRAKKRLVGERALAALDGWLATTAVAAAAE